MLKQGKVFLGEADVVGNKYITAYKPIKDLNGKIIGMWYVGVPAAPYEKEARDFARDMLWFALIGIALAVVASLFMAKTVAEPLAEVETAMARVAEGDLGVTVKNDSNDEIGKLARSLNTMIEKISRLISQIKALSETVNQSSVQLAGSVDVSTELMQGLTVKAEELAGNALKQAEVAESAKVVISEMSNGIQQVAVSSQTVATSSHSASSTAEAGEEQVGNAIRQMEAIARSVGHAGEVVKTLGRKSAEIGQIVTVITGIAEQTNLLALNAAIEAARAGEQGRGFAVVAEEVRKLAEESQAAAQKIAYLIKDIQQETDAVVQAMDQGTNEVKLGTEAMSLVGESFTAIIQAVKSVTDQIQEVSAASQQMSAGTEEALRAVEVMTGTARTTSEAAHRINAMTEEQMAGLEEIDAAASYLKEMAQELDEAVSYFRLQA